MRYGELEKIIKDKGFYFKHQKEKAPIHSKPFSSPREKARDCPGGARELFSWISTLVVGLSFSLPIKSRLRTAAVMSIDPNPR